MSFLNGPHVSDDFMSDRGSQNQSDREALWCSSICWIPTSSFMWWKSALSKSWACLIKMLIAWRYQPSLFLSFSMGLKKVRAFKRTWVQSKSSQAIDVLPYTAKASMHYGDIRAVLEKAGQTIGVNDLHIAAHARSEGLVLVTNNTHEFVRVPGLLVENWVNV